MEPQLTVHGFDTSNNMKVRVALGYKEIPYVFRAIDPAEREAIVQLTGQHLTPVIEHGNVVLFDSSAILRYLDANFPDTPRLFGASRDEQWEIEDLELFARTRLAGPMMEVVHRRVSGRPLDETRLEQCAGAYDAAATELAERLGSGPWLVGDELSAADVTAAPVLYRVSRAELFPRPAASGRLAEWVERVMAYDGRSRVAS